MAIFRDKGTKGQRDKGTKGRRDKGTKGQRDKGTKNKKFTPFVPLVPCKSYGIAVINEAKAFANETTHTMSRNFL